jgi:hypothetical protein
MKMKTKINYLTFIFLICSGPLVMAQQGDSRISELKVLVELTIAKKCYLTELSGGNSIIMEQNTLSIGINFNNSSLMSFWGPDVAVQYIHDAALSPLLHLVWGDNYNKYKNFSKIKFKVDIRPHDIPPVIFFEIDCKDWQAYQKSGDKETFYKKMVISAQGKPYTFDAHNAIGIE